MEVTLIIILESDSDEPIEISTQDQPVNTSTEVKRNLAITKNPTLGKGVW